MVLRINISYLVKTFHDWSWLVVLMNISYLVKSFHDWSWLVMRMNISSSDDMF